jgi:hypothetical protein
METFGADKIIDHHSRIEFLVALTFQRGRNLKFENNRQGTVSLFAEAYSKIRNKRRREDEGDEEKTVVGGN